MVKQVKVTELVVSSAEKTCRQARGGGGGAQLSCRDERAEGKEAKKDSGEARPLQWQEQEGGGQTGPAHSEVGSAGHQDRVPSHQNGFKSGSSSSWPEVCSLRSWLPSGVISLLGSGGW